MQAMPVNLRVLRKHIKISPRATETVRKFSPRRGSWDRTHELLHARLLRIPLGQLGLINLLIENYLIAFYSALLKKEEPKNQLN